MEGVSNKNEKTLEQIEKIVLDMAIGAGIIQIKEEYKYRYGKIKSYSGEGIVEYEGSRYRVEGHPSTVRRGDTPSDGWVRVYKLREWQE
ncbi:MAG: hypothetical protein A2655_02655 [Candidatus Yanofskybacteria bacterium RIFCSPHIGHO2_01_FULL_43_42]|uniref:Uncharacterized protein n=1 Tax=Candidatus Yanofskybacteria bacterium RIFCSPLOWO2_01_FULL_43_22 TaxID=1802695 RepID=A0A1F8GHM4_9BACT|nr:MAG: hypothetical protein A2655_02655 [Candidatus Yanofskybacteria bacterium RIFCSPHIGHO2_01_FULL_43_42]OGN12450.1 MAG: hypothetical protein A3D48_00575 [Candidatus Yanofskybacteria bacterium RIFCSPHIGHO2_02_FULL_43_17]OGN24905.1 MAG: hypothetical protein A3A13_03070 [Candidatus Yanofskybacteria bacterium RIFCSPLOWO2_01_FULL_43_22]